MIVLAPYTDCKGGSGLPTSRRTLLPLTPPQYEDNIHLDRAHTQLHLNALLQAHCSHAMQKANASKSSRVHPPSCSLLNEDPHGCNASTRASVYCQHVSGVCRAASWQDSITSARSLVVNTSAWPRTLDAGKQPLRCRAFDRDLSTCGKAQTSGLPCRVVWSRQVNASTCQKSSLEQLVREGNTDASLRVLQASAGELQPLLEGDSVKRYH